MCAFLDINMYSLVVEVELSVISTVYKPQTILKILSCWMNCQPEGRMKPVSIFVLLPFSIAKSILCYSTPEEDRVGRNVVYYKFIAPKTSAMKFELQLLIVQNQANQML